jgi:SAM-dependent methyltransferase
MISDEVIREKIVSFPYWHFVFDLNGNLTRKKSYRQVWRKEYFFDPIVELLGGSLEKRRVLDLACNAGYWSWCSVQAGCDYVLGIDGRQMHIEQANFVFEVKEVEKSRYDFIASDIFATDFTQFGTFDVVLCPGLVYHISKHMELMEKISAVNSDILMIDTRLAGLPGSAMRVHYDRGKGGGASVDYPLVMTPTREAVRDLAQQFGYSTSVLKPDFGKRGGVENPKAFGDYRWPKRGRRAFICAKKTDLGRLTVETESIERPKPRSPKRPRPDLGEADRAKLLLGRTDRVLSKLFNSRRWQLAHALGVVSQVLRMSRNALPEDQLRELKGESRALLQQSGRASSGRRSKRGSRTN